MTMHVTKIRAEGKGIIKFFNERRQTGLVRPDDGTDDFYINVANSYSGEKFERGARVSYGMLFGADGKRQVVDLRRL